MKEKDTRFKRLKDYLLRLQKLSGKKADRDPGVRK